MKHFILLFFITCIIGCTSLFGPKLGDVFDLNIGESVSIQGEDFEFQFNSVPEDIRCPTNVVCSYAGYAIVVIRVRDFYDSVYTPLEPHQITYGLYTIKLIGLNPKPFEDFVNRITVLDSSKYVARFVVTKE